MVALAIDPLEYQSFSRALCCDLFTGSGFCFSGSFFLIMTTLCLLRYSIVLYGYELRQIAIIMKELSLQEFCSGIYNNVKLNYLNVFDVIRSTILFLIVQCFRHIRRVGSDWRPLYRGLH